MGSHSPFDYTMIGQAENLAARLEGINKQFGNYDLISEATMKKMNDAFPARDISSVAVVGRREPVVVYEPMMTEDINEQKQQIIKTFAEGLKLFYAGDFRQAQNIFSGLADKDPAARSYVAKCQELIENPPKGWNGVWIITTK